MITMFWFGFVCCGIANGAIFSQITSPEKYLYMVLVLFVCLILVRFHRKVTERLIEENGDYDEDYSPIFVTSTVVTAILISITLIIGAWTVVVGLLTAEVGFILAGIRESMYV